MLLSDAVRVRARSLAWAAGCWLLAGLVGCGDDDDPTADAGDATVAEPDAGTLDSGREDEDSGAPQEDDAGSDADVDAGEPPLSLGGLTVNTTPDEQALDLFGQAGHRFWLEVASDQLLLLNADQLGGEGDDIYTPGGDGPEATYADHLLVQDAVSESVADYGKVEIALVGESTYRQWNRNRIPNVRIDADEFVKDNRVGTFEHIRLNNALVGSIFREGLAHTIYRQLGYPALRSSHAFLGSNVWGEDVWVPMTLIEMYKRRFCRDNAELLGGSCENMWEFAGDLGNGGGGGFPGPIDILPGDDPFPIPRPGDGGGERVPDSWCQVSECDNARLIEVMDVLAETAPGAGFEAALDPYIDWQRYHEYQCLSWIMWTGDDPIHNQNNNLIIERDTDHKLIWAPYSVDISAGQDWYLNVSLPGTGSIATGCQQDPDCWAETIATCEDLIVRFDELNPEELVDDMVTRLTDLDMMRYGDDERAEALREWLVWRQASLGDELERFRYLPDGNGECPQGLELCNDQTCGTTEQCSERQCLLGELYCESSSRCYNPTWDMCPECDESTPIYCGWTSECIADIQTCIDACESDPFFQWCEAQHDCVPTGNCFGGGDGDGDGHGDDGGILF